MGKPTGFIEYRAEQYTSETPAERIRHYREFTTLPGTDVLSRQGARCMDCGVPFCHSNFGCPVYNLIPEWNDLVYRDLWREAYERLNLTNNFPEFTGRLCPAPCESACTLSINDHPVTIKQIELAIIERAFDRGWVVPRPPSQETGRRVAVIGSGPAGLAAAQQLRRVGHQVTVFERSPKPGGLLRYGIPDFKWNLSQMTGRKDIPRIYLTFSPDVTRQTKRLEVWVDERNQLKEKILGTPKLRISHVLHNVDKHVNELKLVVEAMAAFARIGRRRLTKSLKVAGLLAAAAFLFADSLGSTVFGFPSLPLLPALFSGQFALPLLTVPAASAGVVFLLWGAWFRKWTLPRLRRRYLKNTDDLVSLDTEYRAHKWSRARSSVQRLLADRRRAGLGFSHQKNFERVEAFISDNLKDLYGAEPEAS